MPNLDAILAVAFAGFVLSATPGPSMLYVLSRSVGQSRAAGYASALGLGLGGMLLAIATAFGLAALFRQFDWLMTGLRVLGSGYLVYLAVGLIRDSYVPIDLTPTDTPPMHQSFFQIVWQGIWVELLNPKTVLFFALFLPPFVDPTVTESALQFQLMVLGILVPLTAIPSDIAVAWLGSTVSKSVARNPGTRKALAWAGGLAIMFIAVNIHLSVI
ncbi:LysE family translocator [uncultured Marivita sp.]|uniref:LysE family translocator n=1 Tax=uncultured Marivita sp. TaxID=888080 RepID=UPI00262E6F4E|nr:LysE family translocator [uncultured Marivita sp.]